MRTVTFSDKVAVVPAGLWFKKGIDMVIMMSDRVWKFVGARRGIQEVEEIGMGFEGWYWRNSVAYSS